jgi:hypothetical protein
MTEISFILHSALMNMPLHGTKTEVTPIVCGKYSVEPIEISGRGGGGSVFKSKYSNPDFGIKIGALKVSRRESQTSVKNECEVLKHLAKKPVNGVER